MVFGSGHQLNRLDPERVQNRKQVMVFKGAASPSLTPDFKRGGGPSTYKPLLFFLEGMQSVLL